MTPGPVTAQAGSQRWGMATILAFFALGTDMFDSQRAGMATIVIFFVVGMLLLWRVPDVRR